MATINFPSNPLNNARFSARGKLYEYNSVKNKWTVVSGLTDQDAVATLAGLTDVAKVTPTNDHVLTYASANTTYYFAEASGGGVTSYANTSAMPLSNNSVGDQAFTTDTNRLYIWNGSGWFNIALVNQTPNITTGGAGSYLLALDGTATVITLVAEDPEGFDINWTYQVTSGTLANTATITQSNNVFTITPSTNSADAGQFSVTFSASDGVNIATDVNSFTLTFLSPLWKDVVLSLETSSTNGLQNNSFIDRSTNAHTATAGGNVKQSEFHPYLNNWSVEFDGTNSDVIQLDNYSGSPIYSSNDDLTIEMWVKPNTTSVIGLFDGTPSVGGGIRNYPANNIGIQGGSTASFSLPVGVWSHFAAVFTSNTLKVYVNGVQSSSISTSGYLAQSTFDIGTINNGGDGKFDGKISNFRITTSQVYTAAFTPPSEPLAEITGTTFLGLNGNRFGSYGTYSGGMTISGSPVVSADNPFGQDSEYAIGENKGSAYFDGDDYIDVGDSGETGFSFDADFTVEFWYYPEDLDSNQKGIIGVASRGSGSFTVRATSSAIVIDRLASALDLTATWPGIPYQWYHIAIVRSGSVTSAYINGEAAAQTGSYTGTYAFSTILRIGDFDTLTGTLGYLTDIKIVKGTAVYTSNFTPPTAPLGNTNAQLYMPMDNAGIFDKTSNKNLTLVGDVSTSTTQTKFADTSVYFDGSDRISLPGFVMNGDFTIEAWIYPITASSVSTIMSNGYGSTNGYLFWIQSNKWNFRIYTNSGSQSNNEAGTEVVSINTWTHIALTREGSTVRSFVNGVLDQSTTSNTDDPVGRTASLTEIGSYSLGQGLFYGYMENLQVLDGVAKYTTTFTPPTLTQGRLTQTQS